MKIGFLSEIRMPDAFGRNSLVIAYVQAYKTCLYGHYVTLLVLPHPYWNS